jgi:hypothetical protein
MKTLSRRGKRFDFGESRIKAEYAGTEGFDEAPPSLAILPPARALSVFDARPGWSGPSIVTESNVNGRPGTSLLEVQAAQE